MWEKLVTHPRGRLSQRILPLLATSFLAAVLLCIGIGKTTFAEDAYRTQNGFSYQGKTFDKQVTISAGDPRNLTTSSPVTAYEIVDLNVHRAEYLAFPAGADPASANAASYVAYDYTPPSSYKLTAGPTPVTITNTQPTASTQSTNPAKVGEVTPSSQTSTSTCNVPGTGWLVCPVTSEIANMIDGIYGVLIEFLDVHPMEANGPVYDIWAAMRNIANVCFAIAFLVIIYSQVTSIGISTYSVKKMLPRLIIAAILVNVSYWICALGIDLSNFLGHSLHKLLMSFAQSINIYDNKVDLSWKSIADGILGATVGGTIIAGAGAVTVATAGSLAAALFTLLGMLLSVILSAVAALFILMARQALLVVFTIISPLAFVALIFPKTEQWFNKWKDTFVAMLVMFPIFSIVFGGAVLAGAAIIAGANNNIFLMLLGKGTQLLPLAITPLIVKFSTGVLGKVAQFTNDRNKGAIDRAKNWANGQADYHRRKSLAYNPNDPNASKFGRYNVMRKTAQRFDNQKRTQELEGKGFEAASQRRAQGTAAYRKAYNYAKNQDLLKDTSDNVLQAQWDDRRMNGYETYDRHGNATRHYDTVANEIANRNAQTSAKKASEQVEKMHAEIAATGSSNEHLTMLDIKNAAVRAEMLANADATKTNVEDIAFTGIAKKMAERTQQDNLASILEKESRTVDGIAARKYAGGIQGEQGEKAALAYSVALQHKQHAESVSEMAELIKHYAPDSGDLQKMITGKADLAMGYRKDKDGNVVSEFKFEHGDSFAMEAAIENNMAIGTVPMVEEIVAQSGRELVEYRTTISSALAKSGMSGKSIYLGGRLINEIAQGKIQSRADLDNYIKGQIVDGKFSATQLATIDAPAIKSLYEVANSTRPTATGDELQSINELSKKAYTALTDPQIRANVKRNAKLELLKIAKLDKSLPPINPSDL